jgi:hypothetical protein
MAYTTELTEDYMGIVHAGSDVVTGDEVLEACRSTTQLLQNTENFQYEFIDFSDASELRVTEADLAEIVEQDRFAALFRPDAVIVIVAPGDQIFETAKQWEKRVQDLGWKTLVSRSRPAAMAWLKANYPTPGSGREQSSAGSPDHDAA